MARSKLVSISFLVVALTVAAPAGAEMYRYVDETGNTHFVDSLDNVPPQYLNQIEDISADVRSSDRVQVIEDLNARPGERAAAPSGKQAASGPGFLSSLGGDGSTLFLLLVVGGPVLFILFALLVKSSTGWLGLPKPASCAAAGSC